jgi:CheY-like chemotaxis protein
LKSPFCFLLRIAILNKDAPENLSARSWLRFRRDAVLASLIPIIRSRFGPLGFDFPPNLCSIPNLMTKPLAMIHYERLMPGSQLVNRLQDLGYRVLTVMEANQLLETARREKPMVAILDLGASKANLCSIIQELKADKEMEHLPVIGFAAARDQKLHAEATRCGANLVAYDDALLPQLPHLLEHALHLD